MALSEGEPECQHVKESPRKIASVEVRDDFSSRALPAVRHAEVITSQTKTRQRVRDLAEVYTHQREVSAMLDLVSSMLPSADRPGDIGRRFLEPSCGAGNFLVAILDRKLAYVEHDRGYRSVQSFEAGVLIALSSIYGIDIDPENVEQSRGFLKADVAHHVKLQLNTEPATDGFWSAVDTILHTNIVLADALKDAQQIRLVEYRWQRKVGHVMRHWSYLEPPAFKLDLFDQAPTEWPEQDEIAIHYSLLGDHPEPVAAASARRKQ